MDCKICGRKVYAGETCSCGEKAPKIRGIGVAVNSVICGFILVITVLTLIFSFSLRQIMKNDILQNTLNDIDLAEIEVKDSGKNVKLDKYIYDNYIADERITVENVDNVLRDPFIKNFLIEKLDGIKDHIFNGGEIVYISSEDIIELMDNNRSLLYNEVELDFLEPDKKELRENLSGLDKLYEFYKEHMTGWFMDSYVKTFFSFAFIVFLIVLLVIILAQWMLVYKLNERRMLKALKKYSIVFIVPAALIFIPTTIANLLMPKSLEIFGDVLFPFIIISGVLVAAGIILLVLSIILADSRPVAASEPIMTIEEINEETSEPKNNVENTNDNTVETEIKTSIESIEKDASDDSSISEWARPEASVSDNTEQVTAVNTDMTENKPVKSEFVFCTACGSKNRRGSKFCTKCGNKLRS